MGLNHFFMQWYYWVLLAMFLAVVLLFIWNIIAGAFNRKWFNAFSAVLFILILFLGAYLRHVNVMNNDPVESLSTEYKLGAKTFYENQQYRVCYSGTIHDCEIPYQLPRHVQGYPFLVSLMYYFTGFSEYLVHVFNAVVSILIIVLAYLLSYAYFRDRKTAVLSSLGAAVLPLIIVWGTTGEVVITNIFFISLSLFCIKIAADSNGFWQYMLAFFTCLFTTHMRAENVVLLLILAYFFIRGNHSKIKNQLEGVPKLGPAKISMLGIALLMFVFNILFVKFASGQHGGLVGATIIRDIKVQTLYIFEILAGKYMLALSIGFILLLLAKKYRKSALPLILFFFIHLLMVVSFHQNFPSGTDIHAGAGNTERYFMSVALVLIVCGVQGLWSAVEKAEKAIRPFAEFKQARTIWKVSAFILIGLYFLSFAGFSVHRISGPSGTYSNVSFRKVIDELRPEKLYVSSYEVAQYAQVVTDDVPVTVDRDKGSLRFSGNRTGVYYIELVSEYFPEKSSDYLSSRGITPAEKHGVFWFYDIDGNFHQQ